MKNPENEPVNEWNDTAARLVYLTGGPLDSLLAQLSRVAPSPPAVTAGLLTMASDKIAPVTADLVASAKMKSAINS